MIIKNSPIMSNVKLEASQAFRGISRKIHARTALVDSTVPKHYVHELNSRSLNFDSIAYLLEDASVLNEVVDIISDSGFWDTAIRNVTASKSGLITPGKDSIPFTLVYGRVEDTLTDGGYKHSKNSLMVVSMLTVDLLNGLGLMGSAASLKIFDTHVQMFITKHDVIKELYKDRVRFALDQINFGDIKVAKAISIAGIIDQFESSLQSFVMSLDALKQIPNEVETLISLVKAYLAHDFSNIDEKELYFFEQTDFLELAQNLSFIYMATASKSTSPKGGSNYWARCLNKVSSGLKSSARYTTVELKSIKEYFSLSTVEDLKGFRKGVIVSKNMKEEQPLEIIRVMSETDLAVRLVEDKTAFSAFSTAHTLAKRLDSTMIHDHVNSLLSLVATEESDMFLANLGISPTEAGYLAAITSDGLEIDMTEYEDTKTLDLVYSIDTHNSLIVDNVPSTFGLSKVKNPNIVLVYAEEFMGGKAVSFKEKLVTEVKNVAYTNIKQAFTDDLGIGQKGFLTYAGDRLNLTWHLDDLAGLVNLDETFSVKPLIGRQLYASLFAAHELIISYGEDGKNVNFGLNANAALIKLLDPLFQSSDIDNLLSSALSKLWEARKANVEGEAKFSRSMLAKEHVKAEIRLRLSLFVLIKLGFITEEEGRDLSGTFKKAGSFDLYTI